MGTHVRFWAGVGNVFRIFAVFTFIAAAVGLVNTVQWLQSRASESTVLLSGATAAILLLVALLLWEAKPSLMSGRPFFVRWLAGAYLIFWVVTSFGLALILLGIAYLTAGSPSGWDPPRSPGERAKPSKPSSPQNWNATGRVGLSGAHVYIDLAKSDSVGIFDSGIPVQVLDKQAGYAFVVAASGDRGWIDLRTLTEGA